MTKLIVAFINIDKNKVGLSIQIIKPAFSTAQKFKVNLAPDYLPVERGHLLATEFKICEVLKFKISECSGTSELLLLRFCVFCKEDVFKRNVQ